MKFKHIALTKDSDGNYPAPNMPCGVLPFYVSENQIFWGCIESNRVGVISYAPPTGTQDIIASKDGQEYIIEYSKPFPKFDMDVFSKFAGILFKGKEYQLILDTLEKSGFKLFLEKPLATAIHETFEEHGADLRMQVGKNLSIVQAYLNFEPQVVQAKRGTVTQMVVAAHLSGYHGVDLKYTDKVEQKIAINRGKEFYEKGMWIRLVDLKEKIKQEETRVNQQTEMANNPLSVDQTDLILSELAAVKSRYHLMEMLEASAVTYLQTKGIEIQSEAKEKALPYELLTRDDVSSQLVVKEVAGLFSSKDTGNKQLSSETNTFRLN